MLELQSGHLLNVLLMLLMLSADVVFRMVMFKAEEKTKNTTPKMTATPPQKNIIFFFQNSKYLKHVYSWQKLIKLNGMLRHSLTILEGEQEFLIFYRALLPLEFSPLSLSFFFFFSLSPSPGD